MLEKNIEIDSDGTPLAGTVCLPAESGRFPTVLMIHGSGPLDRDENMKGQKLDVFNTLAHHLAGEGIASLRYDKRGCGASGGDFGAAGHFDHVADASRCLRYLEAGTFAARGGLFALGHSEGTIAAAQLSPKHPALAGLILLAPFVESMESILMRQARHMREAMRELKGLRRLLARIALRDPVRRQAKLIERIKTTNVLKMRSGFETVNTRWLRELISLDSPAIFGRVTCPTLLISGGKDVQCDPADAQRIAGLMKGGVQVHVVPDLTHVLRTAPGTRTPSFFDYGGLLARPVDPAVLELVSGWIQRRIDGDGDLRLDRARPPRAEP